ncbi:HAD family hydrolase [Mycoplasma procyoni]|uniref:HAD family hydrolase n=1 Tax=Mycoplasma procyoni TaxID=568784 RepID=UPI00197C83A3|nr:HAD family hydrolase [Mycoplasma procyoni]MBN3534857.1 HAD family hydrolase [Mycoplasma procyoni]
MKKFFAFDLDGTLLTSQSKIHPETIKAFDEAKAKGHYLAIATGRAVASTTIFLEQYPHFDYIISNNGTVLLDVKSDETFINNYLSNDYFEDMLQEAKDTKSFFSVSTEHNVYHYKAENEDYEWLDAQEKMDYNPDHFKTELEIRNNLKSEKITQLALRNSSTRIEEIASKYRQKYQNKATCLVTNRVYLDINPLNSDKYNGIKMALDKLNLTNDNLVTFGDSGNDILMLKNAKYGVAMGNGTDASKEAAYDVIGDHNTDAIAKKVRELI